MQKIILYSLYRTGWLVMLLLVLVASSLFGQSTVSGTVTDEDGLALTGVSVYPSNNTGAGTLTDLDGQYTLNLTPEDDTLVFSYVGYSRRLVAIDGRTQVNVRMGENPETLQEVVVIAYGEAKREDIVGSVDQVTSKEIENLQVNSVDQALAGQVAGVQVRTGSGRPDGGAELLVRGVGTTSNNSPLIVIDGIPFNSFNDRNDNQNNNILTLLNPNDIASVSVIRDASGKALYGSRAGNGLIIITTKRGRKGKPTINVNVTSAVQVIPDFEKPDNLNAAELAQFLAERQIDAGVAPEDVDERFQNPERYGEGTDWYDLITRTGRRQNVDLSVRGGTDNSTYAISAGYTDNTGVIEETDFRRYSIRATLDATVTPWLKLGAIVAPSWTEANVNGVDPGTGQFQAYHVLQVARWADPSAPAFDDQGNPTITTRGELLPFFQANPLYRLQNSTATQTNRQFQTQLTLAAEILPGLTLKQLAGANLFFNRNRTFSRGSVVGQGLEPNNPDPPSNSRARAFRREDLRLISETTLNFQKTFNRHTVDLLAGYVAEFQQITNLQVGGSRLIIEDFTLFNNNNIENSLPTDPENTRIFFDGNEQVGEQALVSYIGRAQYNFDQRYYLTGSIRRDASSRFGPGRESAIFPAIALAWRPSRESWFPNNSIISDLRFEVSVGETGNNNIGDYQYQGVVGRANYILGESLTPGFTVTGLPNLLLGWETVTQTDIGVELGLFENRVNVEATYYTTNTEDLLFRDTPLPRISGFGSIATNVGEIENRGVEFQVRTKPVVKDDFVWTFDFNVSVNRNEVKALGFGNTPIFNVRAGNGTTITRTIVGQPVGQYYGLQILGLFTPEQLAESGTPRYPGAVPGAPNYVDGDGDGILESQDDYVFLGDPFPDFIYGLTSFVTWKDLSLRVVGNGEQGSLIYDLAREIELNTDGVFNMRREVLDRYRPGSNDFTLRTPTTVTPQSSQRYRWPNSLSVVDGSFFRISNITLAYRLDRLLESVPAIRGASLSFAVQNAFVFSPFRGNPETGRASGALERSINYNTYPSVRTFTVGLNANL